MRTIDRTGLDKYIVDISHDIQSMAGGFMSGELDLSDDNLDKYNDLIHRYIQIQITDRDPEWSRLDMEVKVNLFSSMKEMKAKIDRKRIEENERLLLDRLRRRATFRRILLYPWVTTLEYLGFFKRSAQRAYRSFKDISSKVHLFPPVKVIDLGK